MNRLKDIPKLERDGKNLSVVMEAVREALQTFRGYRGDPLDRALTKRDAIPGGSLAIFGGGGGSTTIINNRAPPFTALSFANSAMRGIGANDVGTSPHSANPDYWPLFQRYRPNITRMFLSPNAASLGAPYTLPAGYIDNLIADIQACEAMGVAFIVAVAPTHTGGIAEGDRRDPNFWASAAALAAFGEFWAVLATALKPYRRVVLDLVNEPLYFPIDSEVITNAQSAWITRIRVVDPDRTCMVEPTYDGSHIGMVYLKPVPHENIVYSIHFYAPFVITHALIGQPAYTGTWPTVGAIGGGLTHLNADQGNLQRIRDELAPTRAFKKTYGVEVCVGEFSCTRGTPALVAPALIEDCITAFEEAGLSHCFHSFFGAWQWHPLTPPYSTQLVDINDGTTSSTVAMNTLTGSTKDARTPMAPLAGIWKKNLLGTGAPRPPSVAYAANEDFELAASGRAWTTTSATSGGGSLVTQNTDRPFPGKNFHARLSHNDTTDAAVAALYLVSLAAPYSKHNYLDAKVRLGSEIAAGKLLTIFGVDSNGGGTSPYIELMNIAGTNVWELDVWKGSGDYAGRQKHLVNGLTFPPGAWVDLTIEWTNGSTYGRIVVEVGGRRLVDIAVATVTTEATDFLWRPRIGLVSSTQRNQTLDVAIVRHSWGARQSEGVINAGSGADTTVEIDPTPPPTPTGLAVSAGMRTLFVGCAEPTYVQGHGHDTTVVYGAKWPSGAPPTFSGAVRLFEFKGTIAAYSTDPDTRWCIWIKWKSSDGFESVSPAGGTNGAQATTGVAITELLALLTNQITATQLDATLTGRVNLIDGADSLSGSVAARILTETNARMTADTAIASSVTTLTASVKARELGLPLADWTLNGQSLVTISDGKVGSTALRLVGSAGAYPNQGTYVAIDRTKKYRVSFWARPVATTAGLLYFSLQQFTDNAGTTGPDNGGRSPYKPVGISRAGHNTLFGGTDQWGEYSYIWEAADWQTGVKYVRPDFLDNYNGAAGYWEIQNFTFRDDTAVESAAAAIVVEATARASETGHLSALYTVRVQVTEGGRTVIGGFGISGTSGGTAGAEIIFGVRADRFYIGAPAGTTGVGDILPFVVQTADQTINGVLIPKGVYMDAAFIKNLSALIANLGEAWIDWAMVRDLNAVHLTAGDGSIGGDLKSTLFTAGLGSTPGVGWKLTPGGVLHATGVVLYGTIYASAGVFAGSLSAATGTFAGALSAATGTFAGSLSAATGTFAGSLSAATGSFAGSLSAATGSFAGTVNVGSTPAISGTTMTGSGAVINSNGTFALGTASGNITYNGSGVPILNGLRTLVGSSPAISGTTMTGSGALLNADGTFALGTAAGNITWNGSGVPVINGTTISSPTISTPTINSPTINAPVLDAYSVAAIADIDGTASAGTPKFLGSRTVVPTGGRTPYSYRWSVANEENIPNTRRLTLGNAGTATVSVNISAFTAGNEANGTVQCLVTDANGRTAIGTVFVGVLCV